MARTLEVRFLSGVSLTIEVVARGTNVITETITMTELSVAKTVYTGTIGVGTGAGDYELMFKIGANYVGTDDVRIEATDVTTYRPSMFLATNANKIADHVRRRTQANVEASADGDALSVGSEYGFIQQAQESSVSGTTLTINKTDGTTPLGTKAMIVSAGASPITGVS